MKTNLVTLAKGEGNLKWWWVVNIVKTHSVQYQKAVKMSLGSSCLEAIGDLNENSLSR